MQTLQAGLHTFRQHLRQFPDFQPRGPLPKLPELKHPQRQAELRAALHELNFAFPSGEKAVDAAPLPMMSMHNGWLFLIAGNAVRDENVAQDPNKAALIRWLAQNVHFPYQIVQELKVAEQRLS